ncbi:MAG: hypothetical protein WAM60_02565 [Candidatus Promineifilaceae bacterium]
MINLLVVFVSSVLVMVMIGAVVMLFVENRLARSQKMPRPTLLATADIALFRPTATPTFRPTPTPSPIPTTTPSPTPSFTSTPLPPTETATATLPPGVLPSPTLPPSPTPPNLRLVAGQPQPYLEKFRLVTYYGVPTGPQLGVLGSAPRPVMLQRLRAVASQYQALSPDRFVMPTYHIITTIADPYPGEFDNYSHWLHIDTVKEWVTAAEEENVAVILDIQPGYADISYEVNRLKEFLYLPHVHLALDPEFTMEDGEIPSRAIGQIYADQINEVQKFLNDIALETGLNKVLIIHQFEPPMVRNKDEIIDYPYVELVFDADGFGGPGAKIGDYQQYAAEPGFEFGGLKLFYTWDAPLLSPGEVMALEPQPAIIVYQ